MIILLSFCIFFFYSKYTSQTSTNGNRLSGHLYPIIYVDEKLELDYKVKSINYFKPIFSPNRPSINPARPALKSTKKSSTLQFKAPGEYYLKLNSNNFLRLLVINRDNNISENVLELFDFITANLVTTAGQDNLFYDDNKNFINNFFHSNHPILLTCGPTLSFFAQIIIDRLNLPVRDVTFTGVWMEGGQLKYSTHNMLEVYLPDKEKWMLFDINNAFAVKWLDAFEITELVRSSTNFDIISEDEFNKLELDYHRDVNALRSINPSDNSPTFSRILLSDIPTDNLWYNLIKIFMAGPGYWGGERFERKGLSPRYDLYLSQYHQDDFLLEGQIRWQDNWNLDVKHIKPYKLKQMLNRAYKDQISRKEWIHGTSSNTIKLTH